MMPVTFSLRSRIAALHLIIFAMLVCRRPDCLLKPQFWAEDGAVFFADQLRFGFWHAITITYAGYLHIAPRIIAALWSGLPIRYIPSAYMTSSIIIASFCCCAFAWPCYRWLISSDPLRLLCCLVIASAIPAGGELIGSICNLQWFLAPVAILLAFSSQQFSRSQLGRIATILVLCLSALSAPALFVVVPLFLWQIIRTPGWQRWKSLAIMSGLGIQGLMIIHATGGGSKGHWNFDSLVITTFQCGIAKCVLVPLFGASFLLDGSTRSLLAKMILALIVLVALLTLLMFNLRSGSRRRTLLSALYIGSTSIVFVMGGRNLVELFLTPANIVIIGANRYFFLPSCLFVFVFALGMQFLEDKSTKPNRRRLPTLIFILAFSLGMVRNFSTTPMTDFSWPSQAAQIEQWKQLQQGGQLVAPLVVPLNPPGFSMTLEPRR